MSLPQVLIVDDDRLLRMIVRDALDGVDCTIRETDSGEAALAIIKENATAVVLLDLIMPGKSGLQILKELKDIPLRTRIIVLSGLDSEALVRQAMDDGAHGFLNKPIHPLDVRNVVVGALEVYGSQG